MLPPGIEAIIGLECHVQLRTASKMFCGCAARAEAAPNAATCPICLGHPGTLPALNAMAVRLGIRAAVALGATVDRASRFARKHYFYPDLPKGYQITQFDHPLATGGAVHVGDRPFGLTRIHLEEDAGKMVHGDEGSLVDWNRAGVPLIEVVGEPEIRSAEDAESYLRVLHGTLVAAGVTEGDLEKGHFRCDANVSVHRSGGAWGTRVEVKNINSFRFVAGALRYEIARQAAIVVRGGCVERETRMWADGRTVTLRKKEGNADYRYFPEPDLPPLVIAPEEVEAEVAALPDVPLDRFLAAQRVAERAAWGSTYGLDAATVGVLLGDDAARRVFTDAVAGGGNPRAMANLVQGEVLRRVNEGRCGHIAAHHLVAVQQLMDAGTINRDGARALLDVVARDGGDPAALVGSLGLGAVSDEGTIRAAVATLVDRFPAELAKYRDGNSAMLGFFMGQLMAATGRRADPKLATRLLREALDLTQEGPPR